MFTLYTFSSCKLKKKMQIDTFSIKKRAFQIQRGYVFYNTPELPYKGELQEILYYQKLMLFVLSKNFLN
ncbi:hypothetical protein ASG61_26915 [Bacillus sp. Leaf75]|nr:hypothetical protein ASG61_26915 [Bacillus sp. Leaf75]